MKDDKSIKSQNSSLVALAVLAHLAVFAFTVVDPGTLQNLDWREALAMGAPGALMAGLLTILSLALRGFMTGLLRDRIVHLRWQNPLPGHRAFSEIARGDSRIKLKKLRKKYGKLPKGAKKQGQLFYSIYVEHRNAPGVRDALKSYLAMRDMAIITAILGVGLPTLTYFITRDLSVGVAYAVGMFVAFLLLAFAARGYSRRLVENTLAQASN